LKFAFSTLACPQWSLEQVVENALRLGYEGIELRLLDGQLIDPVNDATKVEQAVARCRESGLDVCALDTSCKFNHPDAEERAKQETILRDWIRLAQSVQVPILRVFGGQSPETTPPSTVQDEDDRVAESLRNVAPQAEQANVTIALETHDAFSSALRVAQVLKAVGSPAVGALWDSHHPYRVGESALEVVATLRQRIVHVHIKDARRSESESSGWALVLLGEGEVPVKEQLELLEKNGYTGYVSVEWEKMWHPEIPEPEIALPQHMQWLRSLPSLEA
jgi:sugar phosphate isomerase/epimerase